MGTKGNTGMEAKVEKNKVRYPSFSSDKDMGMKMGQKVTMEGEVVGVKDDQYGKSTTIEIHDCKPMGKMEKSKTPDKDWDSKDIMKYRREQNKK